MTALRKSHDNEKKLIKRCRELKADILSNSVRLQHVRKVSSESPANIYALKNELEHAWGLVAAAAAKENQAKDRIKNLKEEIATLSSVIEKGESGEVGADAIAEVARNLEKLSKEKTEQAAENAKLREEIDITKGQITSLQDEILKAQQTIAELGRNTQEKVAEAQQELRKKEKMEKEMNEVREQVESKQAEIEAVTAAIEHLQDELEKRQEENRVLKFTQEQSNRKLQLSEAKLAEAQGRLDAQVALTEGLRTENEARLLEVKQKEEEVNAIKSENIKLLAQNEAANKRLRGIEEKRQELEQTRNKLREGIEAIDRDLLATRKAMESDRKVCEELTRERDVLTRSLFKMQNQAAKQANLLKLHEQSKQNLEQEIANYKQETLSQREMINMLEAERDHYLKEASGYTQKVLDLMEEVKYREMEIFDNRKKIAEAQTKLKQQENLYEAVTSDRNLYSKNLIEAQEEISEMKRKLNVMTRRIAQLKEELANKDVLMVREMAECNRMTRERDKMQKDLEKMKNLAIENRSRMETEEAEERRLLKIIAETEFEGAKHKKDLNQVISEKDILGVQLVRRNDELAKLYEKIRIQKSVLDKGEAQFNKVLEDLKCVREEICQIRREKAMLQASAAQMEDLEREVIKARKELNHEQVRCKALEDELKKPINVHRWRKLEGSDPSTFEMIRKIHTLQKRLIGKTEEVLQKEIQIQKKESKYVELKQVLVRQPGPEIAEQLAIYQNSLREKLAAMKLMTAEAEKYDANIKQYKQQLEEHDKELESMKRTYFAKKRKREKSRNQLLRKAPAPDLIAERTSPVISLSKLDISSRTDNSEGGYDDGRKGEGEEEKKELGGESGSRLENDTKLTESETEKSDESVSVDKETEDGEDDANEED
ncbi:hypothetical protein Aperf_G00000075879 [Anoplocephala perfoliata]